MTVKLYWAAASFVRLNNLCYNGCTMEENIEAKSKPSDPVTPATLDGVPLSPAEERARRWLIGGLVVAALFVIGLIALLTVLSVDAYQAAAADQGPTPGEIVVSLLRDAAIIFVAFETLFIGILLMILMVQVNSLVVLLRDEIKPMLEAANETLSTVRGTTQFVSHNVVSPVVKWSGYLAGLQRIVRELTGLRKGEEIEE
jgi:hypothetical protein